MESMLGARSLNLSKANIARKYNALMMASITRQRWNVNVMSGGIMEGFVRLDIFEFINIMY